MTNLEQQIAMWHERRFGPHVDVPATYRKLMEEVGELGEALMRHDSDGVYEETGDVAMVLCHLLRGAVGDDRGLLLALAAAADKCERRLHNKALAGENE